MHKISVFLAAALILAGVGGWIATISPPDGAEGIDAPQITTNAREIF